jgi:hypothetical protein
MKRKAFCLSTFAGLALAGATLAAPAPAPLDAKTAFEKMKSLAGSWRGTIPGHGDPAAVDYRLTGNGTALVETLFPGTPHEMMSVYHLDGDRLVLNHYCAAGNQPNLRLDLARSTADRLQFVFDGGTSLDPAKDNHVHEGWIQFLPGGKLKESWTSFANGVAAGEPHALDLARTSG